MADESDYKDLPPRWAVYSEPRASGGRQMLRIGQRHFALDDIQSFSGDEVRERQVGGLITGACIFMVAAMVLAFGVFENGWRPRFLLGTLFLGFLGTAGLLEASKIKKQRFFEIKFIIRNAGVVTFASADAQEVSAFLAELRGAQDRLRSAA